MSAAVLARWPAVCVRLTALAVVVTGIAVLLGWVLDVPALKSVLPGVTKMAPLTALSFVLAGAALWSAGTRPSQARLSPKESMWRWMSHGCAWAVAAIGGFRLLGHLAGWEPGVDQLWFRESVASTPAFVAPATALSFVLLGIAVLLGLRPKFGGGFQFLAVLAGLIGWLGLSHYLYGGEPLFPYARMAVHTALGFLFLSAGILCLRTDDGLVALLISDTSGGMIARRLVPAVLFVPIIAGWLRLEAQRAGWFGTEAGISLFALVNIVVFGALVWASALLLHRSDVERRTAQQARRASEQLLHTIVDHSPAVIYVKDLAGRYLLVNRRYGEIFRLTPEAILGKTDHELFAKEAADAFRAMDQRVVAVGRPLTEEETAPETDGPHTYLSVKCPLRDDTGKTSAVFGISTDITERKRHEEALRASEERTRLIVETALDAVITIDSGGVVRGWNPQAETTFGWTHTEAVGRSLAETIIPERYREAHARGMKHFLATGEGPVLNRRVELAALHRDGREFPIELAITPIRTGDAVTFSAFVRDITDRKRAELALRESQQRFQMLAESLPHLVWTCRPDGFCDYLSRQWVEYTGRPAEEQFGAGWAEHLHPDDRARAQAAWTEATKRGDQFDVEFRIRRGADGVYRWFKTRAVPLRDDTGQIVKWFGSNTDFDDNKRAEQRLQTQLGRLDLLHSITRAIGERQDLRSIFQVVVRRLEDDLPIDFGCVCLYEQATETLTVTSVGVRSEALARDLAMSEEARISIDQNGLSRCVRGKMVYEPDLGEVRFPFPQRLLGGGLRSLVVAPLLVESKVFGVLVAARRQPKGFTSPDCEFLRQLSEHVALAAHQAQIYAALQQAYDDLRQSQQTVMQQERLRALGQMASGIAHDINNAISPIGLYAGLMLQKEPNLSPQSRESLQVIERAIDDVAATVARLREFYRQREPQLTLVPLQMNRLAQQVLDLTRARWSDMPQQRGVVIDARCELEPDLPVVMGVESEIREALTNLIFNAVDAMPDGGRLTLRTRVVEIALASAVAPAARNVHVDVGDTGVGMDEETRKRCLEPFFTTKGERGTGLGLAMVYGIVQRHSADLDIESKPGQGTTVRLIFAVPAAPVAAPAQADPTPATSKRFRVLVVDDDPLLLKSVRDALEADGHMVEAVNGGRAGIEAFQAAQKKGELFDAVFTDLGMPYVDGRMVAGAVKAASPDTPVILLTGWGQRLVAEGDIPPHVDAVLSKPPKFRELRETLARHCSTTGHG